MNRALSMAALAALILLAPAHALAGAFRAMPLRLYLDAQSKSEVFKITNEDDEQVTLQIDAKRWSQDEAGNDLYEATTDIVVFPKMVTIDKGETRLFRVGHSGTAAPQEQTYRLFVQELPVNKPGELALKFALTMSLPLFVAPDKERLDWSVEPTGLAEESLTVKVINRGNRHVMVNKLKATGLDASGAELFTQEATGWYTLAGQSRPLAVNVPYEECLKATRIKVEAQTKESSKQLEMAVDKTMCTRKPAPAPAANKNTQPRPRQ